MPEPAVLPAAPAEPQAAPEAVAPAQSEAQAKPAQPVADLAQNPQFPSFDLPSPPSVGVDFAPPVAAAAADAETVAAPARAVARADALLAPALLPQFNPLSTQAATSSWLSGGELLRRFEELEQGLQEEGERREAAMASGLVLTGGLSIGYVIWLVRGGVLLSSMLSALPAWQLVDPLPVLAAAGAVRARGGAGDDDPDVERLFDDAGEGPTTDPDPDPAPCPDTPAATSTTKPALPLETV